jgi:hypothetical protein
MRLIEAFRRRGPGGVALEASRRVAAAVIRDRRLLIFRSPVDLVRRLQPRLEPGRVFTTRAVSAFEGLELCMPDQTIRRALESHVGDLRPGEDILVGLVDDRLAAWSIVACATRDRWPLTETGSYLALAADDAVFTAGYVVTEFRGRGVFQAMYGASADLAAAHGASTLWSWCEDWNEASRRAMTTVGFDYVGWHARRTVLGVSGALRVGSGLTDSPAHE